MITWRDKILHHFQPGQSRLTLAADPNGLLTEAGMLAVIRARGFELMTFEDAVAFRYAYESQYRQSWDEGQTTPLVVVLRSDQSLFALSSGGMGPVYRHAGGYVLSISADRPSGCRAD